MGKYKKISKNIQEVIIDNPKTPVKSLKWVNISNAQKKEIEYLRKNFSFNLPELHASMSKSKSQRPIVKQNNNHLFVILHFPVFKNGNITTEEIEFFIGHGYLVTVHNNEIGALNDFFNLAKKDNDSILAFEFESSAVLLYEILEKLIMTCYDILDQNSIDISKVEKDIFAQKQKIAVSEILQLKRNILNFRRIMQNHKNILKKLMQMESSLVPTEDIKKYYIKLIDHTKRLWENLENQKEMTEILYTTNDSLLNYHLSDIMKTLTIFSVIVFPLSLFAGIFGMNIDGGMPLLDNDFGFWIIIMIMITASLFMLLIFERKRWL